MEEENLVKIQNYEVSAKREIIERFIKIDGIKKVQIARILGINRKTIEKIGKEMNQKGQMNQKDELAVQARRVTDNLCSG